MIYREALWNALTNLGSNETPQFFVVMICIMLFVILFAMSQYRDKGD